jgi:hypothetical protein
MGVVLTSGVSFAAPSSMLTRDRRFLTTNIHLRLPLLDLRRSLAIAASSPWRIDTVEDMKCNDYQLTKCTPDHYYYRKSKVSSNLRSA